MQKSVKIESTNRIAYLDLGSIFAQKKQYKNALLMLRNAERLDPSQPDVHYELGRLYNLVGNPKAAQMELKKASELHQKNDEDVASKVPVSSPPPQ